MTVMILICPTLLYQTHLTIFSVPTIGLYVRPSLRQHPSLRPQLLSPPSNFDPKGNDTSSPRDEEGRIQFRTLSRLSLDRSGIALVKVMMDVLKQYDNRKVSYSFQGQSKTDVSLGRFGGARE